MIKTLRKSLVTIANEQVSIVMVCRLLGVQLPDSAAGKDVKTHCPFGQLYHSDQGQSPAMRVYLDSNSAFCFSCSMYYTPVSLAARGWDLNENAAARRLLDKIDYRPMDLAAAWNEAAEYEPAPNKTLAADALKTYCRRIDPTWTTHQFNPAIASTLTRCLSLLDLVSSADDVTLWLSRCKLAMQSALSD